MEMRNTPRCAESVTPSTTSKTNGRASTKDWHREKAVATNAQVPLSTYTSKIFCRPQATPRSYSLSAVIIARDEERCIVRCIKSIREHVDRILIVDTGSSDETPRLSRDNGATVRHYVWSGDFSAARNFALEQADSDWNLVIDADEYLTAGSSALTALKLKTPNTVYSITIRNTFDTSSGPMIELDPQARILPRGVRFSGKIHEQPEHNLDILFSGITLDHDGYRHQILSAKLLGREKLLQEAHRKSPGDDYIKFQIARTLELQNRLREASHWYRSITPKPVGAPAWHHVYAVQMAHVLTSLGKHHEALEALLPYEKSYSRSSDYYFVLGNVLFALAPDRNENPRALVTHAVAAWTRALSIGEESRFSGHVLGRGSFLAQQNLRVAREALAKLEASP